MNRSDAPGLSSPDNHLIASLPREERRSLLPHLERTPLAPFTVLQEPGQPPGFVYFPIRGVVSLLRELADGRRIEVGLVGREGMVDLPVFLGSSRVATRAMVQVAGEAWRLPAAALRARLRHDARLQQVLLRYTHRRLSQLSQAAVCNAAHPVEQRLCRWLLMIHDRVEESTFALTQDLLANMLGVRRASVNAVARRLKDRGLIEYRRGEVTVLDRQQLEEAACECHAMVRAECEPEVF